MIDGSQQPFLGNMVAVIIPANPIDQPLAIRLINIAVFIEVIDITIRENKRIINPKHLVGNIVVFKLLAVPDGRSSNDN